MSERPSTAILVIGVESQGELLRWRDTLEEQLKRLDPGWHLSADAAVSPKSAQAFVLGSRDLDFVYFKPGRVLTRSALLEYREAVIPAILGKNLASRPWIYLDDSFRHVRQHLVSHGVTINVGSFLEAIVTRWKERGSAAA